MRELEHKTTIRISKELLKSARMKALQSDVTLSEAIRAFLTMWVADKVELPA